MRPRSKSECGYKIRAKTGVGIKGETAVGIENGIAIGISVSLRGDVRDVGAYFYVCRAEPRAKASYMIRYKLVLQFYNIYVYNAFQTHLHHQTSFACTRLPSEFTSESDLLHYDSIQKRNGSTTISCELTRRAARGNNESLPSLFHFHCQVHDYKRGHDRPRRRARAARLRRRYFVYDMTLEPKPPAPIRCGFGAVSGRRRQCDDNVPHRRPNVA
ncbi:hypothetical protein EVAR_59478_1 [Eumeta japonica]|uniref:Uncharacterized protein n=1 Tax=Eumeta variegata TaxID=151549 RepID=A0A4C1YZF1_EUMVA|nr:hypothetical protein EVAR_59478_1 [Eumeta japonica]